MRILTFVFALLIAIPAYSQRSKNKADESQPVFISEGIIYSLPRTGIRVTVQARQTTTLSGPYAAWAEPLLGIRDAATQPQTLWEIEKINLVTFSEPDPEQTFMTNSTQSSMVQLTPEGCLAGINSQVEEDIPIPVVTNSLVVKNYAPEMKFQTLISTPGISGRSDMDQRAMEAAGKVIKARAARYDISAGLFDEFHPDGNAYEESFNELRKIEKENLELFTGKSASEKYTFTFDYLPPSVPAKGEVIFRFDEKLGFLPASDFSGVPVMVDIEKDKETQQTTAGPAGELTPGDGKTGIYYRQPGMANIRLTKELTIIATTRTAIAQFGRVKPVPAALLTGSHCIEFHPETGAIKSITKK